MIVHFAGDATIYHPATGINLDPGENEVTDEQGKALVKLGLVKAAKSAATKKEK